MSGKILRFVSLCKQIATPVPQSMKATSEALRLDVHPCPLNEGSIFDPIIRRKSQRAGACRGTPLVQYI